MPSRTKTSSSVNSSVSIGFEFYYVLANMPFNNSHRFLKDDDVRWQPRGERSTAKVSQQRGRGGVHQFGVTFKRNTKYLCKILCGLKK